MIARGRGAGLILAALVVVLDWSCLAGGAVASGRSSSYVYWVDTTNGTRNAGTIGRADIDGTHVNRRFITGLSFPLGVAVDGTHIYWANTRTNSIGRANLDGTHANESFITGASCPVAVAVNSTHIFWANSNTYCSGRLFQSIGRADLDGKHVNERFMPVIATALAVTKTHIYWSDFGSGAFGDFTGRIGRANIGGTHINHTFITGATGTQGLAVGVNREYIYWDNSTNAGEPYGTIGRAYLGGADPNQSLIITKSVPGGLAVDRKHIYWANGSPGPIGRANLDGTHKSQKFIDVNAVAVAVG